MEYYFYNDDDGYYIYDHKINKKGAFKIQMSTSKDRYEYTVGDEKYFFILLPNNQVYVVVEIDSESVGYFLNMNSEEMDDTMVHRIKIKN